MLMAGLTGSIAVGKSFVVSVMRGLGCHTLDADQTAREVVAKGTDGLAEIVLCFGDGVLTAADELDRKRLGEIVFADEKKRELLNSIVHPRVVAAQDKWLHGVMHDDPNGIAVVDAALMIESGGYRRFDRIIVVWCLPEIQLERLMKRDRLSEKDAKRRIAAQMPQDEKKSFADDLIDTSKGFDDTRQQTEALVRRLREIRLGENVCY
ncbi:MAG: dephospho-CoA kinase [Pyrinomonadaceae bacterium]|nr:dephospho-CoA kinase [Pyrinomonadaceae bacterium]